MKKFLILLIISALAISVEGKIVQKSGKIITEERDVKNFTAVDLRCSGEMTLTQGNEESLIIEAPEDIMPLIESDVRSGRLVLDLKRTSLFGLFKREHSIKFTLVMKEIEEANISGSGTISATDLKSKDLEININGSGEFEIKGLKADELDVKLSGSGDFEIRDFYGKGIEVTITGSGEGEISGQVDNQKIKISGSGEYEASGLESKSVYVTISGSGDTEIKVSEELEVNVSGSGDVVYHGHPRVRSNVSGSGDIRQKDSW